MIKQADTIIKKKRGEGDCFYILLLAGALVVAWLVYGGWELVDTEAHYFPFLLPPLKAQGMIVYPRTAEKPSASWWSWAWHWPSLRSTGSRTESPLPIG